ncbi:ParB N-terminal domain-containing protein [Paracoccus denitrificans]|uniref:ParB N-terminal domain-containing protein n=1 Tax=Paracoccus denitrificans TaxID=266 RepID=UPI0033650B3A
MTTHFRPIDVSGQPALQPSDQPAPVLDWLPIARLVVDDRYQRPLTRAGWQTIRRIAEDFRWSRFSPVLVAPIPGALWAIIDGQHRTHAAAICGHDQVPCMSVHMDTAEQAQAFAGVNGTVTRITVHHVFKAALAAGESWAMLANRAVSDAGCTLMTYNKSSADKHCGEVFCIALIRQLVTAGHGATVTKVLTALRQIDGDKRTPLYSDYILRPLLTAVASDPRFLRLDLARILTLQDPFKVLDHQRRSLDGLSSKAARDAFVAIFTRMAG